MSEASQTPEDRLDSWKDIAGYLKRDLSTVQRWELREAMPVHRHVHDRGGSVYAFRSELDVWLESRKLRQAASTTGRTAEPVETATIDVNPRTRSARRWRLAAGAAVLILATVGYLFLSGRLATKPEKVRSLAVLPLQNLSGDPTQEFFVDGMTEALIGHLSTIQGVRVISRTSIMHFKDSRQSLPEIAKTLNVDAIIEGSVVRSGSQIRINAQLIRSATDDHLWSGSYDRELRDVLALQRDVAQAIAREVQMTVSGREPVRTPSRRVSPDAYEAYLKGRFALNAGPAPNLKESVSHFQAAIASDPSFAPAYSGLASAYIQLSSGFGGGSPVDAHAKATRAAQQALELDSELAEAHEVLAEAMLRQWRWNDAEASYAHAIDLNPNDASAHLGRARWLLCQGRTDEALVWVQRARELDPFAPIGTDLGWILFHARRYADAIRELRTVLAARPDQAVTLWILGFALIEHGQAEEAIRVLERSASVSDRNPVVLGVLVRAHARAGRRTEALRILDELNRRRQTGYIPAAAFVNATLGLGEYDQAFVWLERAYEERSAILQFLKVHPFFDPIRNDTRFASLLRRLDFPD